MKQVIAYSVTLNNFNCVSGFYTVGLPSLTSFAGFFHNIEREINIEIEKFKLNKYFKIINFSIAVKNLKIRQGHQKYTKQKITDTFGIDKKDIFCSTIDEQTADGNFLFILNVEHNLEQEDFELYFDLHNEKQYIEDLIEKKSIKLKMCAGFQQNVEIKLFKNIISAIEYYKYKQFSFVVDYSHLIEDYDQFSKLISFRKKDEEYKPYYIPVNIGFSFLENATLKYKKKNALRNPSFLHVYAEPVLSLARYQSAHSLLFNIKKLENLDETEELSETQETEKLQLSEKDNINDIVEPIKFLWQYNEIQNNTAIVTAVSI